MNIVTLTNDAVNHIQNVMDQRGGGKGFRISVKASGCSGYMYQPEIVDVINPDDLQQMTSQGLSVFVDPTCVELIKGTVLDIVTKELGQKQLHFENPNVQSECGCGESFNLKEANDE